MTFGPYHVRYVGPGSTYLVVDSFGAPAVFDPDTQEPLLMDREGAIAAAEALNLDDG